MGKEAVGSEPIVDPGLIIDVGMCDGGDTAYYLHKGYRVLAVEADPILCERGQEQFAGPIAEGRLQILNVGITEERGSLLFYRNLLDLGHSSFDPELGRQGGKYEEFQVDTLPLSELLEKYGVPYYLKIDIEGFDEIAVRTLRPELAPRYLSTEIAFSDTTIDLLAALGYQKFKLIFQKFHTSHTEIFQDEHGWRMLRKAGRIFPPLRSFIQQLPASWRPRSEWDTPYRPDGWDPGGAKVSGSFGEESHGPWLDYDTVKHRFDRVRAHQSYVWWDIHARK